MEKQKASDHRTTIAELREAIEQFVKDRSWERYHTPRNLAISVAIEAAELMECFQWHTPEESLSILEDNAARAEVAAELADVVIYCLAFANRAKIDISTAIRSKLVQNEDRFPIGYDPK